ncbi:MAG: hypothetical protein HY812_07020 [Planctomycetes bacterium]|nr:hypothetical protein [Planctomycetota bacterium]
MKTSLLRNGARRRALLTLAMCTCAAAAGPALAQDAVSAYDARLRRAGDRYGTFGPTGARLYAEQMDAAPGLRGLFCYGGERTRWKDPIVVELHGEEGPLRLEPEQTTWYPSHLLATWSGEGIRLAEKKFITSSDMLVDHVAITNTSPDREQDVRVFVYGGTTPLLERFHSRQIPVDLTAVANVAPTSGRRLFTAGPAPAMAWVECERPLYVAGPGAEEARASASAGFCLAGGFGSEFGSEAVYQTIIPPLERPVLRLRYARGASGSAMLRVRVDSTDLRPLEVLSTGGWGEEPRHWRFLDIPAARLGPGRHTVSLAAPPTPVCTAALDGFFFMEEGVPLPDLAPGQSFFFEVPEQIPLFPGGSQYDSVTYLIRDPGPENAPTLVALQGGFQGDPARGFPAAVEFPLEQVRPARSEVHLLGMVRTPRGSDAAGGPPARYEFLLDDGTSEVVAWPARAPQGAAPAAGAREDLGERSEWLVLTLPRLEEQAVRLAYVPPPGRFIERVRFAKDDGVAIPLLIAATIEVPPETGRMQALLGETDFHGAPVHLALSGPDFVVTRAPSGERALLRHFVLAPGATESVNLVLATGRQSFMTILMAQEFANHGEDLVRRHLQECRDWFAENAPRFSCSDPLMEQAWHYRWFLARHAMAQLDLPDFSLPVFFEGRSGRRASLSTATTPLILAEVRWLRNQDFAQGQIRALLKQQYPEGLLPCLDAESRGGCFADWVPAAALGGFAVNGSEQYLKEILGLLARNVDAVLALFDADQNGLPAPPGHLQSGTPFAPAFFSFGGEDGAAGARLETVAYASFVYASARALAEGHAVLGDAGEEARWNAAAERVRQAVLARMWDPAERSFFSVREKDGARARPADVSSFYPFFARLAPDEPDFRAALAALLAPGEYWSDHPIATVSRAAPGFSPRAERRQIAGSEESVFAWNGSTWPLADSMIAEALANALRYYGPSAVTEEALRHFLDGYTRLHFEQGDAERPLLRECYDGETGQGEGCLDSFQSSYNDLLIRFVGGLVPHADGRVELWPLVKSLEHFRFAGILYHGKSLDITWDRPDGTRVYEEAPEGYTLAIDGQEAWNLPELRHVE